MNTYVIPVIFLKRGMTTHRNPNSFIEIVSNLDFNVSIQKQQTPHNYLSR